MRTESPKIVPLPVPRTGRGWPQAQRGALRNALWLSGPLLSVPYPALRATFYPLCGEKEHLINAVKAMQLPACLAAKIVLGAITSST